MEQIAGFVYRVAKEGAWVIRAWAARVKRSALEFTYIVDTGGNLWLSDRRTEHVACARGAQVLGAGEIEIALGPDRVTVASITNQSTGYCPEPDCWPAVRDALARAGLEPPGAFSTQFPKNGRPSPLARPRGACSSGG